MNTIAVRNGGPRRRIPAIQLALFVTLVASAIFGLTSSGRADGGATHHEVVDRAYNAIDRATYPGLGALLDPHTAAVDGGAVFPDCCYNMPFEKEWWANISEVAHGTAFQNAYLNVVRGAFQRHSTNEADLKAISFLFGVISHNEADNPWHFGDGSSTPAFLTQAMAIDGNDHTSVEIGADVFANVDSQYAEGGTEAAWDFPVDTARAAFSALGYDVPALGLQQGMDMVAALHTVEKGYIVSYWIYRVDLSWTHDNMEYYPVGGVQDGADHSAAAWQSTWVELGTHRLYLPGVQRTASVSPTSRLLLGANAGQQTTDKLNRASFNEAYSIRMLSLAQKLIAEGVVKVHSHLKDGIYTIDGVEILDQQRLDQLTGEALTELTGEDSR